MRHILYVGSVYDPLTKYTPGCPPAPAAPPTTLALLPSRAETDSRIEAMLVIREAARPRITGDALSLRWKTQSVRSKSAGDRSATSGNADNTTTRCRIALRGVKTLPGRRVDGWGRRRSAAPSYSTWLRQYLQMIHIPPSFNSTKNKGESTEGCTNGFAD